MFAIIETSGKQLKVEKGQQFTVDRINEKEGAIVNIDKILLINSGSDTKIGMPWLSGAFVEAKVISHMRGEKIRVFKMKPKIRYKRTKGHRSELTVIEITDIKESGAPKKVATIQATQEETTVKKAPAKKTATKKTATKAKKTA